jgi:predicted phosphoribosyltransferase
LLATRLDDFAQDTPLIVSLSNGGLIVGDGVAASLSAPLHRWGVRSPDLRSRIVIVVDDGLVEASAACQALRTMRSRAPTRLVFAVPVAVREALAVVRSEVDLAIALQLEQELDAVSDRYMRFPTVDDAAAAAIVDRARNRLSESPTRRTRALTSLPPPSC